MTDLEIYKQHETPPEWALKQITGGRLNGKTDINPQWRYLALTQMFGLCGIGWKYEVTKQWLEKGQNEETCAFVNINLYVKQKGEWSDPIPGNGGASFVTKEKNGHYTSDECYKMATTDALSVACKMLGIGASIYSGSKYTDFQKAENDTKEMERLLFEAVQKMKEVTNREEFEKTWKKYPALQKNTNFLKVVEEIGKLYPKQNK